MMARAQVLDRGRSAYAARQEDTPGTSDYSANGGASMSNLDV